MNMIMKHILFTTFLFSIVFLNACSRTTELLQYFEVKKDTVVRIPVNHSVFPYPQTNIFIEFDPPFSNHKQRDFSDVLNARAYDENNREIEITKVYDINGLGRDIEISFKNKKPEIKSVWLKFKRDCSGRVLISSWQPL